MLLSGRQPSKPVQGHPPRVAHPLGRGPGLGRGFGDLGQPGLDRLLEPGRGLAGRRRQRDRELLVPCLRLVGQQDQHPGDGGGLAGAGAAGEDRRAVPCCVHRRLQLLLADPGAAQQGGRGLEPGLVDRRLDRVGAGAQVVADLGLEPVVAVEVEPVEIPAHHPGRDQRRRHDRLLPRRGVGPGQLRRRLVGGRQVEADRAATGGADRERDRQEHPVVALATQLTDPGGDVHVGRVEQVLGVERRQQPVAPAGQPPVVIAGRLEQLAHRVAPAGTTPSRRSESASTSATGGRQAKTPHGAPSTSGVSGPHMPRR